MKIQLLGFSILSLFLFAIFGLLLFNYFFILKKENNKFKYILFSCRLFTISILFLLILNPMISWYKKYTFKPNLNIYLDNSRSMFLIDSTFNFNATIESINNWAKDNRVNINTYLFGDSTREYSLQDNPELFSDISSSVAGLRKNIILDKDANHLIITDGHINVGKSFDDITVDNRNIYVAGFGNELKKDDCYISSINTNETYEDSVDIEVSIGCSFENNFNVELILKTYLGEFISSKSIVHFVSPI